MTRRWPAPPPDITIPDELKPKDGRFGSGPSKVRPEPIQAVLDASPDVMGTSHRQAPVKFVVGALRNGLAELLQLPDGYEIILGNGGTTPSGTASPPGSSSSSRSTPPSASSPPSSPRASPQPRSWTTRSSSSPRSAPTPTVEAVDGVDTYALTHNETSTGVMMPVQRPAGADGLVIVDATSAAGGLRFDLNECDVYYFSPQKGLASDGGLWIAAVSPAAIERIEQRAAAGDRWIPPFVDLKDALDNSRKDQTLNTPALATLFLADEQVQWLCHNGGMEFAAGRCDQSAEILYGWADAHELATPFVTDPAKRSHVVATIDFDESVDAAQIAAVLRANGIVDTEPYRKLGRNQLRIAMFPAIDPDDMQTLTASIDFVLGRCPRRLPADDWQRRLPDSAVQPATTPGGTEHHADRRRDPRPAHRAGRDVRDHHRDGRRRRDAGLQGAPAQPAVDPRAGGLRGDDQTFLVYGDEDLGFERVRRARPTASATPCATDGRRRPRRPGGGAVSQNNPEWCLTFWGTVNSGAILVGLNGWWKTDEIVYGLQDSGAKVLVADSKRFERIADQLDECPDLEHVYLIVDCDPADFADVVGDAHATSCTASTS